MDLLRLFLLDQGFPVEYELDEFNTPHTGTTLRHPQNWLCRLWCRIPLRHLASSPLGNIFWRHSRFYPKQQNHKLTVTSTFLSSNSKHDFCYTMANISPSHIQQCLDLAMYFSLRYLAAKMLSPLHNSFISFPYFFPSYETCSINVNHAPSKNLHIKPNGIFFFILLYFTTTLSEGITYTQEHIFSPKTITNIPIAKDWIVLFNP